MSVLEGVVALERKSREVVYCCMAARQKRSALECLLLPFPAYHSICDSASSSPRADTGALHQNSPNHISKWSTTPNPHQLEKLAFMWACPAGPMYFLQDRRQPLNKARTTRLHAEWSPAPCPLPPIGLSS